MPTSGYEKGKILMNISCQHLVDAKAGTQLDYMLL